MERSLTQAELNNFRNRPHRAKWYLAIHRPASVFYSQLNQNADNFPTSALTINGAQNFGDATLTGRNQTLLIGDSAGGSQEGKVRLKGQINTAASLVQISESGSGLARFYAGKYVTAIDEYRPFAIMQKYDTTASQWRVDDNIAYESHLENYGPIIRMGPPVGGFLNDSGQFTVNFVGTSTQFISTTSTACTWTFPDGQTESGRLGHEGSPVTKVFNNASPNGAYFTLAVTDSAGASAIGRRLIYCFASKNDVPKVEFSIISGGINTSYKAQIRLAGTGQLIDLPDETEMLVFDEASYAGNATSIGGNYPFRQSTVFRGWLMSDTLAVNPFSGHVIFQAGDTQEYLQKTHSKDIFLANSTPPAGASEWVEADNLSVDRAAIMWGKHRSTIMEITDFVLGSGLLMTGKIAFQDLPKGTLWQQISQNYNEKGTLGYVSSDMQGTIYANQDVQISGLSTAMPFAMNIEKQDRRDEMVIVHQHTDRNALVELYSVAASSFTGTSINPGKPDAPAYIGAKSPGNDTDGIFGGQRIIQRGLVVGENSVAGQQLLTTWSGNLRAKLNSAYDRITVPMSGYLKLDPVPQSRVSMDLNAVDNARGIHWTGKDFIPNKITLTYDAVAGIPLTTIEMEEIVNGKGGSAITFPRIDNPPPQPPPPIPPPPPPPPTSGDGFGTAYVFLSNVLARTRDLSATSPTYANITGAITGMSYDFILDPWNVTTRAFALTSTGVWRLTGMDGATPTIAQVLTVADLNTLIGTNSSFWYKIQASINVENYIVLFARRITAGSENAYLYCIYSDDAGDTWAASEVDNAAHIADNDLRHDSGFDIVPHLVDGNIRIYAGAFRYRLGSSARYRIYKSDDGGATWAQVFQDPSDIYGSTSRGPACLNTPYHNNENGNMGWIALNSPTNQPQLFKSTDGFASKSAISLPGTTNVTGTTRIKRLGIEIYIQNNLQVAIWNTENRFFKSVNGSTFSEISYSGYIPGTHGNVSGAGGFPSVSGQYYIITESRYVFVSTNGGITWTNKTGNLQSIIASNDPGVNGVKKGVIVPVWVAE